MAEGVIAGSTGCRMDLSGQVALVTGASRGIGRADAVRLAACGATVAGVARTNEGRFRVRDTQLSTELLMVSPELTDRLYD